MLARHEGIIVLVAGAIPGERVRARVERKTKSVIFARVEDVLSASPARRPGVADPSCGGMDYAHIDYPEQLRCKSEVIVDALRRIGRITVPGDVSVAGSPEQGYRLRAKLHVAGGRAGFFREGSHALCDATATGQLRPESVPAVDRLLGALGGRAKEVATVVVAESVTARQRVLHLEGLDGGSLDGLEMGAWQDADISGVTSLVHSRVIGLAGAGHVTDTAIDIFGDHPPVPANTTWTRQAASFFQANRFLVGALASAVLDGVDGQSVADLYAGVGLFAVALAARGHDVVAVEGDRVGGRDLVTNAEPFGQRLRTLRTSVEDAPAARRQGAFRRDRAGPAAYGRLAGGARRGDQPPNASACLCVLRSGDTRARQRAPRGERLQSNDASCVRSVSQHRARRGGGAV